jgi:hypothetical protein
MAESSAPSCASLCTVARRFKQQKFDKRAMSVVRQSTHGWAQLAPISRLAACERPGHQ